jgi:hypothetical protein
MYGYQHLYEGCYPVSDYRVIFKLPIAVVMMHVISRASFAKDGDAFVNPYSSIAEPRMNRVTDISRGTSCGNLHQDNPRPMKRFYSTGT